MSHIDELRRVMNAATTHGWCDGGWGDGAADAIFAATFPPACRTCDGNEIVTKVSNTTSDHDMGAGQWQEHCPDCPTIAQLLAWGIAVATAVEEANNLHTIRVSDSPATHVAYVLLDALRAVKP